LSRETDSSSSGRRPGRGGSPYPPGTEPYGTGSAGESPEEAAVQGAGDGTEPKGRPEERKTETTLTTRIRINIPGSRPIPPVVMRTPVSDAERPDRDPDQGSGSDSDVASGSGSVPAPGAAGHQGRGADPGAGARHGAANSPGTAAGSPAGPGAPAGGAPRASGPTTGGSGSVPGSPQHTGASESGSGGGEFTRGTSDWFAPRKPKSRPAPASSPGGQDTGYGPGHGPGFGAGTGADSGTDPGAGSGTTDPGGGFPYRTADPYDTGSVPVGRTDTPADGFPAVGGPGAPDGGPGAGGDTGPRTYSAIHRLLDGAGTGPGPGGTGTPPDGTPMVGGPSGPTTGPVTGDAPVPPAATGAGLNSTGSGVDSTLGLGTGPAPFAPGGSGESLLAGGGAGADDAEGARIAGDPVVSGLREGASGGGSSDGPTGLVPSVPSAQPAPEDAPGGRSGTAAASKGRSKLVVLGAALVVAAAVVYGTGLLLDHADVPKRTRVLGVDIGGLSRHEAVRKLDSALGDRPTRPLEVVVNGKHTKLKPSVAGLTMSTEKSVHNASGHDYNPVSVVGSIFGVDRVAEPAIRLDEEKTASAVSQLYRRNGGGGVPKDGEIRFTRGKVVKVPGKPHKGIDPHQAGRVLEKAYRKRAAEGGEPEVSLPVTTQQPKVGKKELDRAAEQFGKPAMSGMVTIKAGHASIKFSPQKSLPKFLTMKPVNGRLVDTYDLRELKRLYGTTFAGVRLTRSDGSKTPVTPQDVAAGLRVALRQTDPAKRVQHLPVTSD